MRRSQRWIHRVIGLLAVVVAMSAVTAAAAGPLTAGPQPDGTAITPQGWRVTPAGTQTTVGPSPLAVASSPDGSLVLVENAGYNHHSLMVLDPATGVVLQTITAWGDNATSGLPPWQLEKGHPSSYYVGLAWSPDGRRAYASDGTGNAVHGYTVSGRTLTERRPPFNLTSPGRPPAYPAGIAVSPDGSRLYAVGNLDDTAYVLDAASGRVLNKVAVGHLPYGVALNRTGSRVFVTNWGGETVSVLDPALGRPIQTIAVGTHPCAIIASPVRDELYVANSDSDSVSVIDLQAGQVTRTIDLRPYPGAPVGASPNGLAISPDGSLLYVANAGDNDIAVVRLAATATETDRILGLIPTAWYPSGVALDAQQSALFVANMKGLGVGPAPAGIYWPTLLRGTVSRIPLPAPPQLAADTLRVAANDHFGAPVTCPSSVIPATPGGATPIQHVIYVMKENRTYDEVLGDLGRGNGDPAMAIFGQSVTPNTHALAARFTTFDNFYADGEVSADGWTWSNGADANTYNQKNWPLDYAGYDRPYDFGGFGNDETAALPGEHPGRSFLWDKLVARGISYENFGFFVDNPVDLQSSIPGLIGHTDVNYPGWDLATPDQVRMDEWTKLFRGFRRQGSMPTMQFVYLPNDHTWDTTLFNHRPTAMVADNDLALGRLVDAVSHSNFWASTAIFVVEDDAQDGPDHVDGHRTVGLVISPYTQTGAVDSTFYSTVSMLRTMELILGVSPMTQFDAVATPMCAAFTTLPNLRPYNALAAQVSLTALNGPNAPMAAESSLMDFSRPDIQPMQIANEAIWQSVRGAGSTVPIAPGDLVAAP